jgi:hypothetical protein
MNIMNQMNKYILYISVVFNGVLLMILFGIIPFLLYMSILINLGLIWYVKKALEKINLLEEDTTYLLKGAETFSDHLEKIHELEMYYGDKDLQNMIEHSKQLINEFIDFQIKHFDDVELVSELDDENKLDDEEELYDEEETPEE